MKTFISCLIFVSVLCLPPRASIAHTSHISGQHARAMAEADQIAMTPLTQWGGACKAVAVRDGKAYLGVGPRLTVLDVDALPSPRVLGQTGILPGVVESIAISGQYAFLAVGKGGLIVVDIADPARPMTVGSLNSYYALSISIAGGMAYLADGAGGVVIIDVSRPVTPTKLGSYKTSFLFAADIKVVGGYAYVAISTGGLLILNVANPVNPVRVAECTIAGDARGLAIAGAYVLVADVAAGLRIIDIANISSPRLLGLCRTLGYASKVVARGNLAYVADQHGGVQIIDIGNPDQPFRIGGNLIRGYAWNLALSDTFAYVAYHFAGLQILDISAPHNPVQAGQFQGAVGDGSSVTIVGGKGYVSDGSAGLQIVNLLDPLSPSPSAATSQRAAQ